MPPPVGAAIDIGSNSVHLLVAAVDGRSLESLHDESAFLGLGRTVVERPTLGFEKRREVGLALEGFAERARSAGATAVTVVGTEPLRRALDTAALVHEVERDARLAVHVLGHEEEGFLTLLGATAGRAIGDGLVVVDVGGGSSQIVVVTRDRPPRAVGLRLGSARLTALVPAADPPGEAEVERMVAEARVALAGAPDASPAAIVAVGGTAENLLKVAAAPGDGDGLTRQRIERVLAALREQPAEASAVRFGLRPDRARVLPAGGAILLALLERYRSGEVAVSATGLREGALLAAAHAGRAWRDRLTSLAASWID